MLVVICIQDNQAENILNYLNEFLSILSFQASCVLKSDPNIRFR